MLPLPMRASTWKSPSCLLTRSSIHQYIYHICPCVERPDGGFPRCQDGPGPSRCGQRGAFASSGGGGLPRLELDPRDRGRGRGGGFRWLGLTPLFSHLAPENHQDAEEGI